MRNIKYRSDIDGLRGIAVIAVFLFHAFPIYFPGGFLGVDMFFVISGYLITKIIINEIDNNIFNIFNFYKRRINRILPALIFVLLCSTGIAWLILLPDELNQYYNHLLGVSTFTYNYILINESNYFDVNSIYKPLLHLWSLSIEEQFYIMFPGLILLIYKKNNIKKCFKYIFICFIFSFAYNILLDYKQENISYYNSAGRFWEILIGSMINFKRKEIIFPKINNLNVNRIANFNSTYSYISSIMCLLIIIVIIMFLNIQYIRPLIASIIVTLATSVILMNNNDNTVLKILLANKFIIFIGLISYSLYLWHWPLLSFAEIINGRSLSLVIKLLIIVLALLLASITYLMIEKNCKNNDLSTKNLFSASLLIIIFSIGFLANHYKSNYFINNETIKSGDIKTLLRYDYLRGKTVEEYWGMSSCFNIKNSYLFFIKNNCNEIKYANSKKIMLLGDSHAAYLAEGMKDFFSANNINFLIYNSAYCTPLAIDDLRNRCSEINRFIEAEIDRISPNIIVLFANYYAYDNELNNINKPNYENFLISKLSTLSKNTTIEKIIILGQIPIWESSLPKILIRNYLMINKKIPDYTYVGIVNESLLFDKKFKFIRNTDKKIMYISLVDFLCNSNGCLTMVGEDVSSDLIVFDTGHLTLSGSKFIFNNLLINEF